MRHRYPLIAAVAAVACTAAAIVGAGSAGGSSGHAAASGGYTIGFSKHVNSETAANAMVAGVQCWAGRHNVKVEVVSANGNPSKQITDVQTLVTKRVKGIVAFALDLKGIAPAFAQAARQHVPVVSLAGPAPNSLAFASDGDIARIGAAAVPELKRMFPRGGKALILGGPSFIRAIPIEVKAVRNAMRAAGIQILGQADLTGVNPNEARQKAGDLLTRYPKANMLWTLGPQAAAAAGLAARQHGKKLGKNFATAAPGVDATAIKFVKQGLVTVLIDNQPFQLGVAAAAALDRLINKRPAGPFHPRPIVYTKRNASKWLPPSRACR